jgi:cation diffusion facilitator family transporter
MSANCDSHGHCHPPAGTDGVYARILWVCLVANALMFGVQVVAGYLAGSVSLLANALDFLSDAVNYGISLYVLARSVAVRAYASLFKGVSLGLVGLWVAVETLLHALSPRAPEAMTMGAVSVLALMVNVGCALLLYRFRAGDSNRESVWLCSRNDAIGNIGVMVAAGLVWWMASAWPDIVLAGVMAWLALSAAWRIVRLARRELRDDAASANGSG